LSEQGYDKEKIEKVVTCIQATKMPQNPQSLLEEILCDADLANLGKNSYFSQSDLIRVEWENVCDKSFSDAKWLEYEIDFLEKHSYHTDFAKNKFDDIKKSNIIKLRNKLKKVKDEGKKLENKLAGDKVPKKTENKVEEPKRGIETVFRITLPNHIRLSAIADNKANIMLSINAIVLSITISTLVPGFGDNPNLILPTFLLLGVCIVAIIFATLSTRPQVSSGVFTREDIINKRSNLLFFGNFHGMDKDEYLWGMKEMLKDKDYLYDSMIKDLFYLGKVLARKYKYLRMCYNVFMYGIIITVLTFGIMFFMNA